MARLFLHSKREYSFALNVLNNKSLWRICDLSLAIKCISGYKKVIKYSAEAVGFNKTTD